MGYVKLINDEIPKSTIEIVGERIGEILFVELGGVDVYYDRIEPFGNDEELVINVFPSSGNYSNRISESSDIEVEYFVDIYYNTFTTPAISGDIKSSSKMFSLIGKINFIFSHPYLKTLGFDLGQYICDGGVTRWEKQDPAVNLNSDQTAFARLTLNYRLRESYNTDGGNPLLANATSVKLNETNKGYKYFKICQEFQVQ